MSTYKEQLDKAKWQGKWGRSKIRKWAKRQYNKWLRRQSKQGKEPVKRQYRGYES